MSTFRSVRYAVTLLVLMMALVVSAETAFLGNVHAAPTIAFTPTHGLFGALITVTGAGFDAGDTTCSISGTPVFSPSSCTVGAGGIPSVTFVVAHVTQGVYTVTVTGTQKLDFAQASFTVDGFNLKFTPTFGPVGSEVKFTMTGVPGTDTSCSVSGQPSSVVTFSACVVSNGAGNGTFIVGNVPPGNYIIEVTACTGNNGCSPSVGDFAQQEFTVTTGPSIVLIPSKGPTGTHVIVNGTGFLPSDTTCFISSPSSSGILVNPACTIVPPISGGPHNGEPSNKTTGSFYVGNVPIGQYVIRVTGSPGGDFAEAVFNVTRGPQLILVPSKGPTGIHVDIEGGLFLTSDTTCSIYSPSSAYIIQVPGCAVTVGSGLGAGFGNNVTGSFIVGIVTQGQYVIRVTGSSGDFAEAVFNVTTGAFIQLFPTKGPTGTHVNFEGSYFLETSTSNTYTYTTTTGITCYVSSPSSGTIIQGAACTDFKVSSGPFLGFLNVTGSFIVGNVLQGQYIIQVTGNQGDFAQAIFNVTRGPFIQLSGINGGFASFGQTAKGPVGTHVNIEGSYFLSTDTTCSIYSPSSGSMVQGAACTVFTPSSGSFLGFTNVTGSFVVGNVLEGQYVIELYGNQGDFAQAIFNVTRGPFIQLSGVTGGFVSMGQTAKGPTGTHVNFEGSYFLSTDTTCSIYSPSSSSIIQGAACSVFKVSSGSFLGFDNVTGSFIIGNVPIGQYVIQVTGNQGDFAQAIFNVTRGPFIQLSGINGGFVSVGQTAKGPVGTHVSVEGTNFLSTDTTCSIYSPTLSSIITGAACSMFITGTGFNNVTGSFTIGNAVQGQYVIQVTGNQGDFAQAIFNVTRGPFIQLFPTKGTTGTHVNIEGSYFLSSDSTCSIYSPSSSSIIQGAGCTVFIPSTGNFVGFGNVTGSFSVGNVLPGQYVIQVTGNQGDFAQAIFNVTSGPFIQLGVFNIAANKIVFSPVGQTTSGPVGTHVTIEGSHFLSTDTTCSISSPTSASIIQGAACSVFIVTTSSFNGFTNVTGSFIVGNVLPGQYVIQVTGNGVDFAQAIFNVTLGPKITLSRGTAPPGLSVNVNGTGFLPTDTTCTITSPSSSAVLSGTQACVMQAGTGITSGSFIVGNVLPGQYIIQVTGNQGDFAQTILNVTAGPIMKLSAGTGNIGSEILVNGTGFLTTDQSCSISAPTGLYNPILSGSAACVMNVGTGIVRGSFIIGNVPPGEYVIEVTACAGNNGCSPSVGDFAQAILRVQSVGVTLTLFPTNATNGATVTFRAYGLSASDTGCIVQAVVENTAVTPHVFTTNTNLITSPTCSITTPTVAVGSFVVGPYATTNINWTVQVRGTPANDIPLTTTGTQLGAVFNVTASVYVTPPTGTKNTVFTFTGSGFSSTATTCQAHVYPPFLTVPPTLPPACYLSANIGQVSGSIIVPGSAVPGSYGINVGDNQRHNATGIFTVGTPSALIVLNPSTVPQGNSVGVAGTGFNPNDTFCVITVGSGSTAPWSGTGGIAPTCSIAGGYASGSFGVATNAVGGYYLITLTGWGDYHKNNVTGGDFAQNFLAVTLATTIIGATTTTTTGNTITSVAVTTTSVATSFSFSSTTYSTTGILFTSYTHLTLTTVSGQTTTTLSQSVSTTQTQTTVTVTTTTAFTTTSCGPLPCGYSVGSSPAQSFNLSPTPDALGLLAMLLLLVPILLRRLFP